MAKGSTLFFFWASADVMAENRNTAENKNNGMFFICILIGIFLLRIILLPIQVIPDFLHIQPNCIIAVISNQTTNEQASSLKRALCKILSHE